MLHELLALALVISTATAPDPVTPVTPEEAAQVKLVVKEVSDIDEELKAITRNQATLTRSQAAREDEIASLLTRYRGIAINRQSTLGEVYKALYGYRMKRAATVRSLMERQLIDANNRLCTQVAELKKARQELEATDEYKRARLQESLDLRKAFDDFIGEHGATCPD